MRRDNRPAAVPCIGWGAVVVLADRIWRAGAFYFWVGMVLIGTAVIGALLGAVIGLVHVPEYPLTTTDGVLEAAGRVLGDALLMGALFALGGWIGKSVANRKRP